MGDLNDVLLGCVLISELSRLGLNPDPAINSYKLVCCRYSEASMCVGPRMYKIKLAVLSERIS